MARVHRPLQRSQTVPSARTSLQSFLSSSSAQPTAPAAVGHLPVDKGVWNKAFVPALRHEFPAGKLYATVLNGWRPYSIVGVPAEKLVNHIAPFRRIKVSEPTQRLKTDVTLEGSGTNFYVVSFQLDGQRTVKVGIAKNIKQRLSEYFITYGKACAAASERRRPSKTKVTGVYVHVLLAGEEQYVRKVEGLFKQALKPMQTVPNRGSERFVLSPEHIVRFLTSVGVPSRAATPATPRTLRHNNRGRSRARTRNQATHRRRVRAAVAAHL